MIWLLLLIPCAIMDLWVAPFMAFIVPLRPELFPWSMTPDNPIDGDKGHRERTVGWHWYPRQVWWLMRNRAYGFKLGPIGCRKQTYTVYGNKDIKNRDDGVAGWLFLWGEDWNWYFKFVLPIGFGRCLQWAFGWQLDAPIKDRCLFMCSLRTPTSFTPVAGGLTATASVKEPLPPGN